MRAPFDAVSPSSSSLPSAAFRRFPTTPRAASPTHEAEAPIPCSQASPRSTHIPYTVVQTPGPLPHRYRYALSAITTSRAPPHILGAQTRVFFLLSSSSVLSGCSILLYNLCVPSLSASARDRSIRLALFIRYKYLHILKQGLLPPSSTFTASLPFPLAASSVPYHRRFFPSVSHRT